MISEGGFFPKSSQQRNSDLGRKSIGSNSLRQRPFRTETLVFPEAAADSRLSSPRKPDSPHSKAFLRTTADLRQQELRGRPSEPLQIDGEFSNLGVQQSGRSATWALIKCCRKRETQGQLPEIVSKFIRFLWPLVVSQQHH